MHTVSLYHSSVVVSAFASINVVNRHWASRLVGYLDGYNRLWVAKPSRYVTSHLGQLSFPSLHGR